MSSTDTMSSDHPIRRLYEQMLIAWNQQDAPAMAACFEEDGNLVGFDGTQADSRADIEHHLRPIFGRLRRLIRGTVSPPMDPRQARGLLATW